MTYLTVAIISCSLSDSITVFITYLLDTTFFQRHFLLSSLIFTENKSSSLIFINTDSCIYGTVRYGIDAVPWNI